MRAYATTWIKCLLLLCSLYIGKIGLAQRAEYCEVYIKLLNTYGDQSMSGISLSDVNGNYLNSTDQTGLALLSIPRSTKFVIAQYTFNDTLHLAENFCTKTLMYYFNHAPMIQEVEVNGFAEHKKLIETNASIGYIDQRTLNATDKTSIQTAINTVPGVYMDSRGAGGSHKLNIRGSALRAPFAVRNIKIYLDGIALTSPDGQSPLELIDASEIQSVEIIKGPAGSIYGSGNGGVLIVKSLFANPGESSARITSQIGSNLLLRTQEDVRVGFKNGGIKISHVLQDNKGYRRQEFNHKNQFNLVGKHYLNKQHSLCYIGNYYNGRWGLPGALNAKEVAENPKLSNQFSWLNNAHVWRERAMIGVSHQWYGNNGISAKNSVSGYITNKKNPYGTSAFNSGYKTEDAIGTNARTEWKIAHLRNRKINLQTIVGGEFQQENYAIIEQKISQGKPTTTKYTYEVNYLATMLFLNEEIKVGERLNLQAGFSANQVLQQTKGNAGNAFQFDTTATWRTALLPRIAINVNPIKNHYIYFSYSKGNSNPTIFEMINAENYTYNLQLKPENGSNTEVGLKGNLSAIKMEYEISLYRFLLSDAILPYQISLTDSTGATDNITLFKNFGTTKQEGLECSVRKQLIEHSIIKLSSYLNGNFTKYVFKSYDTANSERLMNNRIPGNPINTITGGFSLTIYSRWQLDGMYFWNDRIPLDDRNTVWSKSYHLLNLQLSYSARSTRITWRIYGGINNALNTSYTSFFNLNGVNNRYYNPAQGINYYIGFELQAKKKGDKN